MAKKIAARRRGIAALTEGWIAGAGLDVFEGEPEVEPARLPLRNVVLAVLDGQPPLTPVTA